MMFPFIGKWLLTLNLFQWEAGIVEGWNFRESYTYDDLCQEQFSESRTMMTESNEEQDLENNQSRPSALQPEQADNVKANKSRKR